jgi:hypothetical protein
MDAYGIDFVARDLMVGISRKAPWRVVFSPRFEARAAAVLRRIHRQDAIHPRRRVTRAKSALGRRAVAPKRRKVELIRRSPSEER